MQYSSENKQLEGSEIELTMHDGTVRDLCFIGTECRERVLLLSAGAGSCKIYLTDCGALAALQTFCGHTGHIYSIYSWEDHLFVTGSQVKSILPLIWLFNRLSVLFPYPVKDKTVRFWDTRVNNPLNTVLPLTYYDSMGSPVTSVCVDPTGRLLVSGHEDSSCILYDVRKNRQVQCFQPHTSDIR